MEVLNKFALEEFSIENKYQLNQYSESFEDFEMSWFCEPNLPHCDDRIRFYIENRSDGLDQDCSRLNDLVRDSYNFNFSALVRPCQTYFLIRKEDYSTIGMIEIHCGHTLNSNRFVPEVIYEIAPNERRKGYGRVMLDLLLKSDNIGANDFHFNISNRNAASNGLIQTLNAEIVADSRALEAKTYKLHKK